MKKILIVLAIFASVQVANAQTNISAAKKAVETAQATAQNAKKAKKAATWLKLASAYMNAYNAPTGNILLGTSQTELRLLMRNERPTSTENVVVNDVEYTKEVYADKNLYFDADGRLAIVEVTAPLYEDALEQALAAYKKAFELDPSKAQEISAGIKTVSEKFVNEAYNAYSLGEVKKAGAFFESAFAAAAEKPYEQIDTNSLYNSGFTAWSVGEYGKAKTLFEQCLAYNYLGEDGEVYAKLADCAARMDTPRPAACQRVSGAGFAKFLRQSILIGPSTTT